MTLPVSTYGIVRASDRAVVFPERVHGELSKVLSFVMNAGNSEVKLAVNLMFVGAQEMAELANAATGSVDGTVPSGLATLDLSKGLTPKEAADRLGCTTRTITKACASGRLHAEKFAGRWYIPSEALDDFRYGNLHGKNKHRPDQPVSE